ncbi:MAG: hypothetical protein OHK0022_17850 [Roseiflexaceae bacterium]
MRRASSLATLLRDDEGQVIGTVALFTDITEERRAQEALRLSESTLRLLLEQLCRRLHYGNSSP